MSNTVEGYEVDDLKSGFITKMCLLASDYKCSTLNVTVFRSLLDTKSKASH